MLAVTEQPSLAGTGKAVPPRRWSDRCVAAAAVLGVALLSFLAGGAVVEFRLFPYPQFLSPSFTAARAWHRQLATTSSLGKTDLWAPARFTERGVVRHEPSAASPGYTLYTSGHATAAFLMDMKGRLVHQWQLGFRGAWPSAPHVRRPVGEPFIYWRRAHLYPNGDLLALYEAAGDTPWGYGLIKVNRDSQVIWRYADWTHHDLYVHGDGTIYTLAHEFRDTQNNPIEGARHLGRYVLDDFVVQLSPEGRVLSRVSLLEAIGRSAYRDLLISVPAHEWDVLHTNTVKVVTQEFAAHHGFAKAGQVLVSSRARDALAIVDLDRREVIWASHGPYRQQHDPDLLDNGRILLFDNKGHPGPGGASRIIELDPATQAIHWSYAGDQDRWFYSAIRSAQQRLANGNLLITESSGGRLLEITPRGQTVWEFHNPAQLEGDPRSVAIVCGAARLPINYIQFTTHSQETVAAGPAGAARRTR